VERSNGFIGVSWRDFFLFLKFFMSIGSLLVVVTRLGLF